MAVTLTWQDLYIALEETTMAGPHDSPTVPASFERVRYWDNLRATAAAIVTRYAPDAPEAVANEAATRAAGYLHEHTLSAMSELNGGAGSSVAFNTGALSALRHSGGMAILSPFKVRRAL